MTNRSRVLLANLCIFLYLFLYAASSFSQTIRVLPNIKWNLGSNIFSNTLPEAKSLLISEITSDGSVNHIINTPVGNLYACSDAGVPVRTYLWGWFWLGYINGQPQFSVDTTNATTIETKQVNGVPMLYCSDYIRTFAPGYDHNNVGELCPSAPDGPCLSSANMGSFFACPDNFTIMSPAPIPATALGVPGGVTPMDNLVLYCEGYTPPKPCDCEFN